MFEPARYFPIKSAVFQVEANLSPLGTDFGNGDLDARVIQIDRDFAKYRENKLVCRRERLGKYYAADRFSDTAKAAVCGKLAEILCLEYPEWFRWTGEESRTGTLECGLTGDLLQFEAGQLVRQVTRVEPAYADGFDALVSQIPEDVAVVCREKSIDWLAAVHLCAAGHWAAEQKVGKDFGAVHEPVPGISPITRAARGMVHAMIQKGPFVRFVWGFGSDDRLNHHPEPPPGQDIVSWRGRSFKKVPEGECPFYLRVERQVTLGLPASELALFFIRVSYIDGREIRRQPDERDKLTSVLRSMDAPARAYKGLTDSMESVLQWLSLE